LVPFIWFGASIMALGGLLSLTDRRLRVGAPRRALLHSKVQQKATT
jgi:cytochrome c-type biogenesis protein CcmF